MNKEVSTYKRLLVLATAIYFSSLMAVVLHYNLSSRPIYLTDLKSAYTAEEIRKMIKALPTYQGDSLIINAKGEIVSLDGLIESFISQVYAVPANSTGITRESEKTGFPEPFLAYRTAIGWYIETHGTNARQQNDSVTTKLN
ncbi:MAG: hypothetical protein JSU09_06680 [Bacteroidetes bacterium]|nr:hypothetical protein [Bacteroidota bacterium]